MGVWVLTIGSVACSNMMYFLWVVSGVKGSFFDLLFFVSFVSYLVARFFSLEGVAVGLLDSRASKGH